MHHKSGIAYPEDNSNATTKPRTAIGQLFYQFNNVLLFLTHAYADQIPFYPFILIDLGLGHLRLL